LGYAPSPSVFLSAVAQRTKKLKFGPMVYLLPLYHPLRLIDEVCMLDQMSGGRFLYGVGRGISPIEVGFYGVDFATGTEQFREAYQVIRIVVRHQPAGQHSVGGERGRPHRHVARYRGGKGDHRPLQIGVAETRPA
jgi:alkanesulfonate monooxygenase SsuD/methylene tetrahydromethanopterin reductase-like flavin-dependent oxidoreductase (luciferase family)